MSATAASSPPNHARKERLVNARMQLSVVVPMGAASLFLTTVYLVGVLLATGNDMGPSSESLRRMSYLVTGVYFVLVFVASALVGVMSTHRIAGPARVIEQAVRGMRQHDYSLRLTLRRRDHLKSLAAELAALRQDLREADVRREALYDELSRALAEGRIEDARRLCPELSERSRKRAAEPLATVVS
ncbi:MAG: hypothetical protein IPM29_31140 [Planctomycetes bacterium]|nr:hypothetical protein [Planctomycetota bacterium]